MIEDKEASKAQHPNMTSVVNSREIAPTSSHTNLDVSNLSNVQKELRPNKIVNKGNSVFSNHHKLLQNGKNVPIKALQSLDNDQ